MSKMGRPTKTDAERRETPFKIMLTEAERRAFDKCAKACGLDSSNWARSILVAAVSNAKAK
jgi:hypothetical protein